MKQENVKKLLSLLSNYVKQTIAHAEVWQELEEVEVMMNDVVRLSNESLTDEQKSEMYWQTVHALNAGTEEAEKGAFLIRLRALISGDDEFIDKIEYLHEVI